MTGPQGVSAQPRVIAGRYTLLGELGRGGMGVVWRAQDNVIGRQVAIKELHLPDGIAAEERRVLEERVLREARTAGRLNDPAVVTVFDVVAENGMTYIVMELVEAATLSTIIAQSGPMPQDRVISIALQALSALETAHKAGIVHRDVKPGNLMVQPNGRVKLTDFGIAQAMDDPRLTTSGSLIGSPAYMSPERIHGHEASPASDLWALGATLCYAVEGLNPYERSSTASTLHAIMNEMPRLTRAHGALGAVITGLLMPDPNARLTGPQARAMLDRAVAQPTPPSGFAGPGGPTMQYQPPSLAAPPRKPWVKPLLTGLAAVGAVAFLVLGVMVDRWLFTDKPPAAMAETMTFGSGGTLPEFKLNAGYCGDNFLAPSVRVNSAECDEAHSIEVFWEGGPFGSADKVEYPGEEWLRKYAENFCSLVFKSDRVPLEGKDAKLRYVAVVPTQGEWKESYSSSKGSREVFCVLWDKNRVELSEQVHAKK
ncbi:serine/threonine-protein kinase [Saccharothrix variisporea]|uniref:non-specific serine/threonine protein kinase n=1 Tax=Saccharothrix variisporea TaxID=543527 RepID=A0A495XHF5_9PSEU|nr:serine/threonine-protein kinase [Saccharothrix variisporea]RKT73159.1 protein kinase-like protein [Saccharothrix variisporea]